MASPLPSIPAMSEVNTMDSSQLANHARQLHESAVVIDAHSDILIAVADGRVRLGERTVVSEPTKRDVYGHYDLPRWQEGGITAQVCALFIKREQLHVALTRGLDMVAAAYREVEANEGLLLATKVDEIRRAKEEGKVAMILSFEGVDPLGGNLTYLPIFYQLGVRMASLTHARRNYFAGGVVRDLDEGSGLTMLGRAAIQKMNELGIVVDLRHLDARSIDEILELSTAPVVMSHVNARQAFGGAGEGPHFPFTAVTGIDRRGQLRAIGEKGGVVCTIFYRQGTIDGIVDDVCYVAEKIGPEHAGLGTDLYGFDTAPKGAEDVACFPRITEKLLARGFADDEVRGILGGNLLRLFGQVWK